jgi:hypothetical protein
MRKREAADKDWRPGSDIRISCGDLFTKDRTKENTGKNADSSGV